MTKKPSKTLKRGEIRYKPPGRATSAVFGLVKTPQGGLVLTLNGEHAAFLVDYWDGRASEYVDDALQWALNDLPLASDSTISARKDEEPGCGG